MLKNNVFSNDELWIMSGGITALLNNASNASTLVCWDKKSTDTIDEYIKKLQVLNSKICNMITE